MSGIYIHIPFCKTKCTYCDFFSKTNFAEQPRVLEAMLTEIKIRADYVTDKNIATIYFGGGTPSVLSASDIRHFLDVINQYFTILPDAEITLEANPDDLTTEYLKSLKKIGINRLSIGIQSFEDQQLKSIRRRHDANSAVSVINEAKFAGFDNISIDLIYGLPFQSSASWEAQLNKALAMDVQHISAYALTYEIGTPLWRQRQQGKITAADDETMIQMYAYLVEQCARHGFEQYEISNFATKGFRSRHNSSYWQQIPYLGIGPSAHSFDGDSRQWNTLSINDYCKNITGGGTFFEREILTETDKYNDYVIVRLRTSEGIDLRYIKDNFGEENRMYLLENAQKYIQKSLLEQKNNALYLTQSGILISNAIMEDLIMTSS